MDLIDSSEESKGKKNPGRLLDLKEAAEYLGLSYATLRNYVDYGILHPVYLPCPRNPKKRIKRILLDKEELDAMIEQSKETARG